MYLPDKEDLLLTLTASYHSRVAEIYDDLLGAGLERTAAGYFASKRTTLFPEAALESVREAVNEWPVFFKIPGSQTDPKARERIEEHVEQLVLRTIGRMSGTESYVELMSQVQDATDRLTGDGADSDTLARDSDSSRGWPPTSFSSRRGCVTSVRWTRMIIRSVVTRRRSLQGYASRLVCATSA